MMEEGLLSFPHPHGVKRPRGLSLKPLCSSPHSLSEVSGLPPPVPVPEVSNSSA